MTVDRIVPAGMRSVVESGAYSPAVRAGDFLFVSGQVGRDRNMEVVSSSLEDHIRATFDNLVTVLREAGAGVGDVVELTTYHVGLTDQMPTFTSVKREYFDDTTALPAWTAVGIEALNRPEFLVEIQATAYLGHGLR